MDSKKSKLLNLEKISRSTQTAPISVALSENRLNTEDLLTDFFMELYKKEMVDHKVNESTVLETISKLPSKLGSSATERCCYIYSQATCHTLLVKDCITKFLNEYSNASYFLDTWRSNLKITSLSLGPCLDCVAFNLAVLEASQDPDVFSSVLVIAAHSRSWLGTIRNLSEILKKVKTPLEINYLIPKVNLRDMFKRKGSKKELLFLQSSNVALMFHPFSTKEHMEANRCRISKFFTALKKGALLFAFYLPILKPEMLSILYIHQGNFLYGPVAVSSRETTVEITGTSTKSVPSTNFEFFVWVKGSGPSVSVKSSHSSNKTNLPTFTHHGDPPKSIKISRNGLRNVKMFYSFHDDDDQGQESDSPLVSKGTQTELVALAVLENKLNKNKLVTDFIMEVFKSEAARSGVQESADLLSNLPELASPRNFDDPKYRCGYMYYYATAHTLLIKECFVRFLTDYPNTRNLLAKWRSNPEHCSLSHGPGLDYIGFSLAVLEVSKQPTAITKARIVTTQNHWRHTVHVLSEVIQRVKTPLNLKFESKIFHHQDLSEVWTSKTIKFLETSSVVFMFRTLNLVEKDSKKNPQSILREMVKLLKPGTIIFFMDSATSSAVMRGALRVFGGTYLYRPTLVISRNFEIDVSEELKKAMQLSPAQVAEVEFFAWEKISDPPMPSVCPQKSDQQLRKLQTSTEKIKPVLKNISAEALGKCARAAHKSFEIGPSKAMTIPTHSKSTSKHPFDSLNSASFEFSKVFKPVPEISTSNNPPNNHQLNKIPEIPMNSAGNQPSSVSRTSGSSIPGKHFPESDQCSMTLSPAKETRPNSTNGTSISNSANQRVDVSSQDRPQTIDFLLWLFMEVYNKEINRHDANQFLSLASVFGLPPTCSVNYNDTHIRCAYMYRYATCHALLIKGCITRFLSEYSKAEKLLNIWMRNPCYCSLSLGPGLDYIAFSLAVLERTQRPVPSTTVRMVTSCTGWKSTVDVLSQVLQDREILPNLKYSSSGTVTGSVFERWSSKATEYFRESNLIFMFKSLNLERKTEVDTQFLWESVNILKPGTVILFIDTSYSSTVMQDVLAKCPGTYLHGPVSVACNNIPIGKPQQTKAVLGVIPVQGDLADFFVWEKDSYAPSPPKTHLEMKQSYSSSEIKPSHSRSCSSSEKLLHHGMSHAQYLDHEEKKVVSSCGAADILSPSSSQNPPTSNWRTKQEESSNEPRSFRVKVGNKRKIADYLSSSQDSDNFKMKVFSDHNSPLPESTSLYSGELSCKPVSVFDLNNNFHCDAGNYLSCKPSTAIAPIIRSEVSMDSSCMFTNADVNSGFECDAIEAFIKSEVSADSYCKPTSAYAVVNDFECSAAVPIIKSELSTDSSCILTKAVDSSVASLIKSEVSADDTSYKPASSYVLVSDIECGAVEPLASIIKAEVPLDSSCLLMNNTDVEPVISVMESKLSSSNVNTVNSGFKYDAFEHVASLYYESTQEQYLPHWDSAGTGLPLLPELPSELESGREILSVNQRNKINSLIERIDKIVVAIETGDFHSSPKVSPLFKSQDRKDEESVNVAEINALTESINRLVSILESNVKYRS